MQQGNPPPRRRGRPPKWMKMTEQQIPPAPPAEDMTAPKLSDVTKTPEFAAAVAEASAKAVAEILAKMQPAGQAATAGDQNFAEMLAMSIAQLTDQGTGRKRLAPEVLRARAEARDRMQELIIAARRDGVVPRYTLVAKVYLDEILVEPKWIDSQHIAQDTVIEWPGVPSEAMRPANDVAQGIYDAFMDSIGSTTAVAPEQPMHVTAGGLVVHGRGQLRRGQQPAGQPRGLGAQDVGEGLRIPHKGAPGQYKPVNVLGSVAPPARQQI
jgi:hypothetical protein